MNGYLNSSIGFLSLDNLSSLNFTFNPPSPDGFYTGFSTTNLILYPDAPNGGDDIIEGGDGKDYILGDGRIQFNPDSTFEYQPESPTGGSDMIDGGAGRDYIDGGNGSDYLYGGDGNGILIGGSGADTLAFKVGVLPGEVVVKRLYNNLELSITGASDDQKWRLAA